MPNEGNKMQVIHSPNFLTNFSQDADDSEDFDFIDLDDLTQEAKTQVLAARAAQSGKNL